jgi:hypothetical protein
MSTLSTSNTLRLNFFDTLLAEQKPRPAAMRLQWLRGFRAALEVSGGMRTDLGLRVAEAENAALDDAVAELNQRAT